MIPKLFLPHKKQIPTYVIKCKTNCNHLYYILYTPASVAILRGKRMNTPSTLVSLRITDEEVALLDSRVGLDGARNRSDVIRAAIRSFLQDQPLLPEMDTITIPVGRSMKARLGDLYELHGISHQQAASQGLQDYVRNIIKEEAQLNDILAEGLETARSKTVGRKEFTE